MNFDMSTDCLTVVDLVIAAACVEVHAKQTRQPNDQAQLLAVAGRLTRTAAAWREGEPDLEPENPEALWDRLIPQAKTDGAWADYEEEW